jgi:hypothetical protein
VASSVLSVAPRRPGTNDNPTSAIPIAFAPPHSSIPAGTRAPTAYGMAGTQIVQTGTTSSHPVAPGTDVADTRKRKNEDTMQMDSCKRQAAHNLEGYNQVSLCCIITALVHSVPVWIVHLDTDVPPTTTITLNLS